MPKISVIIPVYNANEYLRRCLDSVCNQTLKDIEIICVDDCSTDNSFEILQEYTKKYTNLKVIHCDKNGGESVARNIGLDNATGDYIAFVDNDDEVDLDFYEKLYNKAAETGADISKGEVKEIGYDGKINFGTLNQKIKENNCNPLFFIYHWWTGIFKSSIIKDNNIKLIEGYPLGGDVLFLNEVVLKSQKITLVDDAIYHYYRREDSGDSKVLSFEKIKSVLSIHEIIIDNIINANIKNSGTNFIFAWCIRVCFIYMYKNKRIDILRYCVDKTFDFYNKIKNKKEFLGILNKKYSLQVYFLSENNKEKMFNFYLENDNLKKMFVANLRYKMQIQEGENA